MLKINLNVNLNEREKDKFLRFCKLKSSQVASLQLKIKNHASLILNFEF